MAVKFNLYRLSSLLLARMTSQINKSGQYRILCLNKTVFSEDLEALAAYTDVLTMLTFPRLLLSEYIKKHVHNFDELNDGSYHKLLDGTLEQQKIYRDINRLFPMLLKRIKFDAIFAGNYVYVSQQEFFRVAIEHKIPVIVLYKEGTFISFNLSDRVRNQFFSNKVFHGDKLLFYNRNTQKTFLESNIPGVIESKTSVVGIPRMDKYQVSNHYKDGGKTITLFSFETEMKTRRLVEDKTRIKLLNRLGNQFQSNLIRFCIENSDFQLIIKIKTTQSALNEVTKLVKDIGLSNLPSNIKITQTGIPYNLIQKSAFVAGFFSTTLLEAIMLNKPVLVPYFESISKIPKVDIFGYYPESVNYIEDFTKLEQILCGKIKYNIPSKEVKRNLIEPYIYSLDGQAACRVEQEIIDAILNT
jgi:hypothetical protein